MLIVAILIIGGFLLAGLSGKKDLDSAILPVSKDKILASQEIEDVKCDETGTCASAGKIIKYQYISDIEVPPEKYQGLEEDITKRTSNAQFFPNGEEVTARIYAGEPFYQDKGKWYQTEIATTTIQAFQDQTKVSWLEKLFRKAIAQTSYYAGAGDGGTVSPYSGVWNTSHNATAGVEASPTTDNTRPRTGIDASSNYYIHRSFFPIDTSAIPDNAVISSSTLYVYVYTINNSDNDGDDFEVLVQTTQADPTTIVFEDFDQCGAIHSATEGSARYDITNATNNAYNGFVLNATGLGWIKKTTADPYTKLGMREGHDIIDSAYVGAGATSNTLFIYTSEQTGTSQDPYLSVSYYIHKTQINTPLSGRFKDSSLVGYWSFDGANMDWSQTTAEARDLSGNANHGDVTNFTNSSAVPGINGQALSFDGVDDNIVVTQNSVLNNITDDITISLWMKTTSNTEVFIDDTFISKDVGGCGSGVNDWFANLKSGKIEFWTSGSKCTLVTSNSAVNNNSWHHVVMTRERTSGIHKIYIDGNIDKESGVENTGSIGNNVDLVIGALTTSSKYFPGVIDEVRIYNRALSASEIAEQYRAGAARLKVNTPTTYSLTSGLVGNWTFNGQDISGTTAFDRSGQNNNGTLTGENGLPKPVIGKVGQALSFDGADDYVNAGSLPSLDNIEISGSGLTVSGWMYFKSYGSSNQGAIVSKGTLNDSGYWTIFLDINDPSIRFMKDYDGATNLVARGNFPSSYLNTWKYIVVTWDGTSVTANVHFYVNTIEIAKVSVNTDGAGNKLSDAALSLGIGGNGSTYSNGLIDEVRIYNRALGADEIQNLYRLGARTTKFKQ